MPGGVVVIDGEGIVQECNPAALKLLDTKLLGECWRDIVEKVCKPKWDDGHDVTLHNGLIVNISTQSLGSEPGQIVLITDVTETRQLQEQISCLKRVSAMGEMAAALAHQIRTPLSSALLYVSNLGSSQQDKERSRRFTHKTISALQHLEKLVEEMLLFARGGRLNVKSEKLSDIIQSCIEQQHAEVENKTLKITFNNRCDNDVVKLSADAFKSVLQNLINNACQSSKSKVHIDIELLNESPDEIKLSITDNGPGIPKSIRPRLFEPFVTGRTNGTGLGLAVVDSVVRAHKGNISVHDVESGGTCFQIYLPLIKNK